MIAVLSKFDLDSADSKRVIRLIIEDLAGKYQHKVQSLSGRSIKIIVNVPLINTAIDMAADTVKYHGIESEAMSNEKRFAHVCFWLIKLHPISFDEIRFVNLPNFHPNRRVRFVKDDYKDIPVNVEISYGVFVSLYCAHNFNGELALKRHEAICDSKQSKEITRSLRFHNYSARTMAMYLESTMMDKLG